MSLTVKHLIDKYSKITESVEIKESEVEVETDVDFNLKTSELSEEENKVLAALNMGIVTEKVLKARRQSRKKKC